MTKKSTKVSKRPTTAAEIRQAFLDFFTEMGHTIVPSAPLVPGNDPTLLFTNSGMVQFKEVFLGTDKRPYTRAADSQKCLRVAGKHNDLDDVGRDDSHHTFFEMLGNWSFGDYYKAEAISWAWTLLTEVYDLPKDRLWTTCFEDEKGVIPRDDEAADIWKQQPGFDPSHVLYFGRKDNFWEMAETGPCGPDSEIHFDRGPEYCDMQSVPGHVCRVNGDCKRFLELWNLVFIQYNRTNPTDLTPLPRKHVDTGMGLERIVSVVQNVDSNYKTDLFTPILATIQKMAGHNDDERAANLTPYRVVADHARAASFLIADGVVPGNTDRNYVCRMVIRRAARFGRKIGFADPFMAKVAETVIEEYGNAYPELRKNKNAILQTLTQEEIRFQRTVDTGVANLEGRLADLGAHGKAMLDGGTAFELYGTYGLPFEITRDIARERGVEVDEAGFKAAMDAHKLASGAGQAMGEIGGESAEVYHKLLADLQAEGKLGSDGVEYNPYGSTEVEEPALTLLVDGKRVARAKAGDKVEVVIARTPFYIEMGGQVGDIGTIAHYRNESDEKPEWEIQIENVTRPVSGIIVHHGQVTHGSPKEGESTWVVVDFDRRWDIMRNHTATHLLHCELRYVLGDHVRQAGSLVAPDRLRFDFTHHSMVTQDEMNAISRNVNDAILANFEVQIAFKAREEAIGEGAMALFGEKYGDVVRTIKIGEPEAFSYELCGGTHVPETADIGPFIITSEGSVGAGLRRVEAVTGRAAQEIIQRRLAVLDKMAAYIGVTPDEVDRKLLNLMDDLQNAKKEIERLGRESAQHNFDKLLSQVKEVKGVPVLTANINGVSADTLREMTDWFRQKVPSGVAALGVVSDGKPTLIVAVTDDLVKRGLDANKIVKTIAKAVGGGGGGKATLAQAGGKDPSRLAEALAQVPDLVASALSQ
ncbi:MAG: alanine--tRNA ligase [Chloroflexi bacterium]|nr:alanine--tRNA ligase [Chloroflexota bacterium]